MPWKPARPGEAPTLGWLVLDWISEYLAAPDRTEYEPLILTREQAQFVLDLYALTLDGKRKYRRGVLSRPKGWGKSPLLAALAVVESLGPVVPDGWDAAGQPVGIPWSEIRTPWVQLAAVSEDQTRNAWSPLLEMIREGSVIDEYPGVEPLDTFVNLPKGRIEFVTSAATSREGNRPVFAVLDQTEEWRPSNGGVKLAATIRRNLGKTGGCSVESPNAFVPGEGSVAEESAEYATTIREKRALDDGLLYDHREAPAVTDLWDDKSLMTGLRFVYGDSDWIDLDRLAREVRDPATAPQDARRFYLNQITHATDSWLSQPEWAGCAELKVVAPGEMVTLGFDGSKSRKRGIADATALMGCRVSDGHLFEIRVWEQPEGLAGKGWEVPVIEVDAEVKKAFDSYKVVGFYADPAMWESYCAGWEAAYHQRLKAKASSKHPIEWWINQGRSILVTRALEQFHSAVVDKELTHDGSSVLTRHVLNARRRVQRGGLWIAKDHPDSTRKIDAAWASVLAYAARLDALASGVLNTAPTFVPRRIR